MDCCLQRIDQLHEQMRGLEQSWQAGIASCPEVHHLVSIPGIGPYSALVLLAEIGSSHRFADQRQLYSYAGLVPRVRESGERKRSGGITHSGSP